MCKVATRVLAPLWCQFCPLLSPPPPTLVINLSLLRQENMNGEIHLASKQGN